MLEKLEEIILRAKKKYRLVIDEVKFQLQSITLFFDRVENPFTTIIQLFRGKDRPSSIRFNKYLTAIEDDVNLIILIPVA